MRWRLPLVVVVACGAFASPAGAATYCVGVRTPGCMERDTAGAAFAAARSDAARDTIVLGRLTATGAFADAPGRPVRVIGLGADDTRLRASGDAPALRLQDPGSGAREVALEAADGPAVQIDEGAGLQSSMVAGRVRVLGGSAALSSVAVMGPGPGVEATCETSTLRLTLEHVTITGSGEAGVTGACGVAGRSVAISASHAIVWGFATAFALGAGARVSAVYSDYPGATGDTNMAVDPGFQAPGDPRLGAGSPLIDAGRPGMLADDEPHEDALGFVRVVDGSGDGVPRRDIGALERQPPAPAATPGNVLSNPGAEAGDPARDDSSSPGPPVWSRTGSFTFVRYGTVAGIFPFPTRRVAEALGGGNAFFAGGPGKGNSATQTVDVRSGAVEIDLGRATASLSALLGGYRRSGDGAIVEAEYRGPGGEVLGDLRIGPVSAGDRGGATTLVPRSGTGAIPPLTRTIAVTLRSTPPAGAYDDAYFDDVALVPRVGAAPLHRDPSGRVRPFSGAALTAARLAVDRRRRAWLRLACATRTVRRCRGVAILTARIGGERRRIGRSRFFVRRGRVKRLPVRVTRAARRALLGGRRRLRGHVFLASRDGQGVTRTSVAPVRVVRGAALRRGRR